MNSITSSSVNGTEYSLVIGSMPWLFNNSLTRLLNLLTFDARVPKPSFRSVVFSLTLLAALVLRLMFFIRSKRPRTKFLCRYSTHRVATGLHWSRETWLIFETRRNLIVERSSWNYYDWSIDAETLFLMSWIVLWQRLSHQTTILSALLEHLQSVAVS